MTTVLPRLASQGARATAATSRVSPRRYSIVALGALLAIGAASTEARSSAKDRRAAVAEVLTKRGYVVSADDVVFLDGPKGAFGAIASSSRALVVAGLKAQPTEPT